MNLGLHYSRFPDVLEGYDDAYWNTLSDESKATSGYIFIAWGVASWKSKKQTILVQSTMESKMIELANASIEASWLRSLLAEIPLWEKPIPPDVLIHCDSTTTIAKIENRYYNGKRRQIRINHSTVRDYISKGVVRVDHVSTDENLVNPLTKWLAREKVHNP